MTPIWGWASYVKTTVERQTFCTQRSLPPHRTIRFEHLILMCRRRDRVYKIVYSSAVRDIGNNRIRLLDQRDYLAAQSGLGFLRAVVAGNYDLQGLLP